MAIAANETKNADLKARLAWITEQVTSEYQSQRFSNALASLPTNPDFGLRGNAGPHKFAERLFFLRRLERDAYKRDESKLPSGVHCVASGPNPVAEPATDFHKCQRHLALQLPIGGLFG